jgi:cytochrome b561
MCYGIIHGGSSLGYDRTTRRIHAAFAFFIVVQLLLSLVMRAPKPDRILTPLEAGSFQLHRLGGVIAFILLLLQWGWTLSGHLPGGFGHLFPWTSRERMKKVVEDMQPLLKLKIRDLPQVSALAGAVHGLGIIVATLMASTGLVLFFGISSEGRMTGWVHSMEQIHKFMAPLMWIYLIGHVSMGILHQYIGHRTLSEMFNLIRK